MHDNEKYLISFLHSSLRIDHTTTALENSDGTSLTYQSLYDSCFTSNVFSKIQNPKETVLIAVFSDKSAQALEIIYAIIASGNAYLPLDNYSPPERIYHILKESGCKSLVIDKKNAESIIKYFEEHHIEYKKDDLNELYWTISFIQYKKYDSAVAYVLYTSGSTGFPKGVIHTHKSAITFINWFNALSKLERGTRFISIAPFSFDVSIPDMYCSLACNGTLFIPKSTEIANPRFIAEYLEKKKINFIYSTPTFFNLLKLFGKTDGKNYSSVKYVFYAGEQLYYSLVKVIKTVFPDASHYNLYGPTETNVCCYFPIDLNKIKVDFPVPIGHMCPYASRIIRPTEGGYELLVNSDSTMAGYVDGKETMEIINGLKYYNTGDIVILDAEQNLVFKTRKDKMVKRNGFRIEICEIELCLNQCQSLNEFVVKVEEEGQTLKIIVYYTENASISELALKSFVLSKLPSYMLPDSFIKLDAISKNINFKIDLNKL